MYRILLADDEPIILSGLQSMLKWEQYDCAVTGTARNGKQALEFIEQHRPNIVICDINMPLLTGLQLLSHCAEHFPEVVFIMLTNHSDFGMAQESLRCRAVDYLLKIDLDDQMLARSIRRAVQECGKRRKLTRADPFDDNPTTTPSDIILRHVSVLLSGNEEGVDEAISGLEKRGAATHCTVGELLLDPARIPNIGAFTADEKARLFDFHYQLVEDVAQKLFFGVSYVLTTRRPGRVLFFLWNLENTELLNRFQSRLTSSLGDISQMQISLLATELLSGQSLRGARMQLVGLRSEFAVCPRPVIHYSQSMEKADYVDAAQRYVEGHILERVSVQDAANAIGITPNYLSSLFKRQLGQNFMDYVNTAKVKYACTMLKSNKHLVYEISHMLGYDNAYYFTKVFKRYMGVTPTEYQSMSL